VSRLVPGILILRPFGAVFFIDLDGTVVTFCTGIADFVLADVEQPFLVAPEHLDYIFDWLQLAAHLVVRPGVSNTD
jgi:hypothetical protein